jgi:hypothetical protein
VKAFKTGYGDSPVARATFVTAPLRMTPRSFTNSSPVIIPDAGAASIYPSTITVSGMGGTISNLTITLNGVSHTWAADVDVLLVGPSGQGVVLLSDTGNGNVSDVTITLSDLAESPVPPEPFDSGTYKPTDYEPGDYFLLPAPPGPYANELAAFKGLSPNGPWSLYVVDDGAPDSGSIAGGWSMQVEVSGGSPIALTSLQQLPTNHIRMTGACAAGIAVTIQASSNLVEWQSIGTATAGSNGTFEFEDSPSLTEKARFYRVALP